MKRADVCLEAEPLLEETADGHYAACHFTNKEAVR